jgi:multicomponent Na+:H+ antiporter subunit E
MQKIPADRGALRPETHEFGGRAMGRHTIFVTIALTAVWIILMEGISWQIVATGLMAAVVSTHFMGKFFGFEEIKDVNFFRLVTYPVWLVARVYLDAFLLVHLILGRPKWGIMHAELELENETLRTIVADSITLTPGSVYITREGKNITLLCIGSVKKKGYPDVRHTLDSIQARLQRAHLPEPTGEVK